MPDLAPLVEALMPLLGPAFSAFLRTTFGMTFMGLGVAVLSFYLAAQGSTLRGVIALLLALATCVGLGLLLAGKRAVMRALLQGVKKLGLGKRTLGLLFERLLGVAEGSAKGERGGAVARTVERLPLAEAETQLREVARGLVRADERTPGLRARLARALQARLLEKIEQATLAGFREENEKTGGVNLLKVRDELAGKVDGMLAERLEGAASRVTVIVVAASLLVSVGLALAVSRLPF
jgi:hypothetical protein